ncbi:MAG: lysophospholipid acyltransferase family protein [Bacteroidales bacterium]|nr:lysophospholipid acyltransferase family protein [Bacteroidales bacterium]
MNTINSSDLKSSTNFRGKSNEKALSKLMNTLRLDKIKMDYTEQNHLSNLAFIDGVLSELDIKIEIEAQELKKIPQSGAFITVSNHPFSGIEGLILLKILAERRPDIKLTGDFLLQKVAPLNEYILSANLFEGKTNDKINTKAIEVACNQLKSNSPLAIFPVGETSSFVNRSSIQDKKWKTSTIKFIKKASVPVVPIYFHGSSSAFSHILGIINPFLRTAKLPSDIFSKKSKNIIVRIGSPITVAEQNEFTDVSQYGRFLRAKTYALGSSLEIKKFFNVHVKPAKKMAPIVEQEALSKITDELKKLLDSHLLFDSGKYKVIFAPAGKMPVTLNEIGRLREITFRAVGEGTLQSIDLDEYDLYYEHLVVWDSETEKIVGAYRVGKGQDIYKQFGKKGFYINSLFNLSTRMKPVLEQSLELGRSFVVKEYQKNPMALFLLWKGILYVLLKNQDYRYLLGPVSISNQFSDFSKSLIIDVIQSYYYHHRLALMVSPKKRFKVNYKNDDHLFMKESIKGDLNKLDKLIEEIEPSHYRFPVLFKKYLKQNARILGFNVDPRFNKALDGLMILDLLDVPMQTIKSLSKELNDSSILDRFHSQYLYQECEQVPQL